MRVLDLVAYDAILGYD
jgi:hypothetical protein